MFKEIIAQAWTALRRSPTRSALTMLGIVWGIVAVTLLIAYGGGFRTVLVRSFEAFGKGAVIGWPGQTSEGVGGQKAGKRVRLELADLEAVRNEATFVKHACLEVVRHMGISYGGERFVNTAVRGVCPEYGEMRNEVPNQGRWITAADVVERRRVVFLGDRIRQKLFSGRNPIGEELTIAGMRFTVIGTMAPKMQMSNYFRPDDDSVFIPYDTAGDVWNTRYANVIVFTPVSPLMEQKAVTQVRGIIGKRQGFSEKDERALNVFGREEVRPIIDGITIGLQVLLAFIGTLTLGIGGVGVMNIMLVSVDERIREIGLRRALGARKWHIRSQFLAEAMLLMMLGGFLGIALSYLIAQLVGPIPMLGPLFEDETGKGDIRLHVSLNTVLISTLILMLVGVISGMIPALRASRLDPVEALRYE